MSRVLRKALLASYHYLIQLQTFMMIDRGLFFNSREIYLSNFPSEDMELGELPFGGVVTVPGVGPSP